MNGDGEVGGSEQGEGNVGAHVLGKPQGGYWGEHRVQYGCKRQWEEAVGDPG